MSSPRLLLLIVIFNAVSVRPAVAGYSRHVQELNFHLALRIHGGGMSSDWSDEDEEQFRRESKRPTPSRRKKRRSPLSNIAKKSISLTSKALSATVKQSGKATYWAMRPKAVDLRELTGLWRLDQQVIMHADDVPIQASASIELTSSSVYVVFGNDRTESRLTFVAAKFPKSARVEFTARAFQLEDGDGIPTQFFYKGYIHRKLLDSSVLKIKGKIYRISRTGFRGKTIKYLPVGTFVARKRMQFNDDVDIEGENSTGDDYNEDEECLFPDGDYDEEENVYS